jgi:uncharacterized membrane protein YcaP (DUF421 family)
MNERISSVQPIHWHQLYSADIHPLEVFIRGSVMYLAILGLFRAFKRQSGEFSLTDLLVLVLVADAAQNGMTGKYDSLPDGLILIGTLIFWNVFLDWLGFRIPLIENLIHPKPLPLIADGKPFRKNMQAQFITMEELMSQLREQGIESVEQVRKAFLEGDGRISVIKRDKSETEGKPSDRSRA